MHGASILRDRAPFFVVRPAIPFRSRKQWRWAFATDQPFARRWAHATPGGKGRRYRGLPSTKDASGEGAPAHGPGGLLATPGLGGVRKWGVRRKATQIAGNLYRGNDGKFQAGGANSATPTKTPKQAAADARRARATQRQAERQARSTQRAEARDTTAAQEDAKRTEEDAYVAAGSTPRERAARRAAVTAERRKRVAERRAAARDASAAERATRAQETASEAAARQADEQAAAAAAAQEKPKGGGGGGAKPKPSDDEKKAAADAKKKQTAVATARQVGLDATFVDGLTAAAEGRLTGPTPRLEALGFSENGEATDQGRRALAALERGDTRGYLAAVQDAKTRHERAAAADQKRTAAQTAAQQRRAETDARRAAAEQKRQAAAAAQTAERVRTGRERSQTLVQQIGRNLERARGKGLLVYKDASGQHRWISRTTTAYRDRDGEIISQQALEKDAARMTSTKQYGPLRWHHVGMPDPFDPIAPWGPGLDIGDCDFSIVIGRTSIESGTFKNAALGEAFAASADEFELSPGFFHPLDQPNAAGEFDDIRRFERSTVPIAHGRASNLFTGLTVKEQRMDPAVYEQRMKTYIDFMREKGVPPEVAAVQVVAAQQADKDATARGIAFKSASDAPDTIVINGVTYKAAPPPPEPPPAAPPAIEAKADLPDAIEEVAEVGDEGDMGGPYIGDMTPDEFFAKLTELLAPVVKMQDMVKSIGDMTGELKSMYGGTATKAAGELATLKAQQADLATRIAAIEGTQPATVLPAELAAALKSEGPQTPPDPNAPQVPNDPNRPWAGWGAQTFPELYRPQS